MRIAIYARTAVDETKIEQQILACKEYISLKNAELQGVYSDQGKSGTDPEREGLKLLIENAEKKKYDVIVTCGHDRLFRDIPAISNFLQYIKTLGISHTVVHER